MPRQHHPSKFRRAKIIGNLTRFNKSVGQRQHHLRVHTGRDPLAATSAYFDSMCSPRDT